MPPPSTRPKNTLFCPRCGHESPTDGDWQVRRRASGEVFACPACGARVTARPSDPAGAAGPSAGWNPVSRAIRLAFAWSRAAWVPPWGDSGA